MSVTVTINGVEYAANEVTVKSYLRSYAGSMEAVLFCSAEEIENGFGAECFCDGVKIFSGRVFSVTGDGEKTVVLCYDQKRFLLYRDSKAFSAGTLAGRVRDILSERGIGCDIAAGESVQLLPAVFDGKTTLAMIESGIEEAALKGESSVLYCKGDTVCLGKREDLISDTRLDEGNIFSITSCKEIDKNTFTRVQLTRKHSKSGRRDHFVAEDAVLSAKWGKLTYYESALQKDSDAYLSDLAGRLLQQKNKEQKTLQVKAMGDALLFAGMSVWVETEKSRLVWITELVHTFRDGSHVMSFYGEEWSK